MALSCGGSVLGNELLTTSGVLVEDQNKEQFITVASHGFPLSQELVFHPDDSGQPIGRIHERLIDSDIAIVRLSPIAPTSTKHLIVLPKTRVFCPVTR